MTGFRGFPPDSDVDSMHWLRDPKGRPVLVSWSHITYEFWAAGEQLPGPIDMCEQGWTYIAPLNLHHGVSASDFPFQPDPDGYVP